MALGFPLLFNHVQRKSYPVLLLMVADVSECVFPDTSKNVIFLSMLSQTYVIPTELLVNPRWRQ